MKLTSLVHRFGSFGKTLNLVLTANQLKATFFSPFHSKMVIVSNLVVLFACPQTPAVPDCGARIPESCSRGDHSLQLRAALPVC